MLESDPKLPKDVYETLSHFVRRPSKSNQKRKKTEKNRIARKISTYRWRWIKVINFHLDRSSIISFHQSKIINFINMELNDNDQLAFLNGSTVVEIRKGPPNSSSPSKMNFTVIGLGSAGHSRLEAILSDPAEKCGFELMGE